MAARLLFGRTTPVVSCLRTFQTRLCPVSALHTHRLISTSTSPATSPILKSIHSLESRILALRRTYFPPTPSRSSIRQAPSQGSSSGGGGGWGNNNYGLLWRIRQRINALPHGVIFYGILGLNVGVFVMWYFAEQKYIQFRDSSSLFFMLKNFTTSMDNLRSGRVWTLITSCFSHADASHILMNGLTFYFMAPAVIAMLGNTAFLTLYLGGGLACSAVSILWNNFVNPRTNYRSRGASGSIYAILAFFACAFPRTQFLLFFVVPVPAWLCVSGLFLWDFGSAIMQRKSTTDSAGHLGGLLGGVLFYFRLMAKLRGI